MAFSIDEDMLKRCLCVLETALRLFFRAVNDPTPPCGRGWVRGKEPDDYLLSHGQSALSSAWSRFTVLFGMGRGGADSLWSSGMTGCCVAAGFGQPGATAN